MRSCTAQVMDPTKIVALLLDQLSWVRHAEIPEGGIQVRGNHSLRGEGASRNREPRRPGEQSERAPSVNNRTLLTFAAMIEAWRTQGTP